MRSRAVPAWLPAATVVLSLAGMAVSSYLAVEHYTASTTLACPDTGVVNCLKVTRSPQSVLWGVPLPLYGLGFFVAMVALGLPAAWRSPAAALRRGRIAAATLGVVFVLYLVYIELFTLDAICLWCTAVHALTVALFAVVAWGTAETAGGTVWTQ